MQQFTKNVDVSLLLCSPNIYQRLSSSHYNDVMMGVIASQITSLTIVYSTVYSDADQRKHQSSASLAFVRGIHRGSVNSPHKWPVTRKMFPFDDVIIVREHHYGAIYWSLCTDDRQHLKTFLAFCHAKWYAPGVCSCKKIRWRDRGELTIERLSCLEFIV